MKHRPTLEAVKVLVQPFILAWNEFFTTRQALMHRRSILNHPAPKAGRSQHQIERSLDSRLVSPARLLDATDNVITFTDRAARCNNHEASGSTEFAIARSLFAQSLLPARRACANIYPLPLVVK